MKSLLLVGCGKMGSILLSRWKETNPAGMDDMYVVDTSSKQKQIAHTKIYLSLDVLPEDLEPDVVVFAVKPQDLAAVLTAYGERFGNKPLYLSIAAGKTVAFLASHLPQGARVVRAMPNLPAQIGEAITAMCAYDNVTAGQKKMAGALMQSIGEAVWIETENENWMDGITAISGSGPAYVFLFMEALVKAGIECGLDKKLATQLVRQTMKGAALMACESDFEKLRAQVTSPGGTTQAAIAVLQENGRFEALVTQAVLAAARRAVELENIDKTK